MRSPSPEYMISGDYRQALRAARPKGRPRTWLLTGYHLKCQGDFSFSCSVSINRPFLWTIPAQSRLCEPLDVACSACFDELADSCQFRCCSQHIFLCYRSDKKQAFLVRMVMKTDTIVEKQIAFLQINGNSCRNAILKAPMLIASATR